MADVEVKLTLSALPHNVTTAELGDFLGRISSASPSILYLEPGKQRCVRQPSYRACVLGCGLTH